VTTSRLWYSLALLLLAPALAARAAEKDAYGDPLPAGARLRLGTLRNSPPLLVTHLLPPKYDTFLGVGADGLYRYDPVTAAATRVAAADVAYAQLAAVSPDGSRAALQRSPGVGGPVFEIFDLAGGKVVRSVPTYAHALQTVSFSADGKSFACLDGRPGGGANEFDAVVWDLGAGAERLRAALPRYTSAQTLLSPDGKVLATFGELSQRTKEGAADRPDLAVTVWAVPAARPEGSAAKPTAVLVDPERDRSPFGLWNAAAAFAPDGKTLAFKGLGGGIDLWDVPSGKLKDTLYGRGGLRQRLAFAPDGKTVAVADDRGVVERWELPSGKPLKLTLSPVPERDPTAPRSRVEAAGGVVFADNDRALAWSRTRIWEVPGGKLRTPALPDVTWVTSVQFLPGGDVVTGHIDQRVWRWDRTTARGSALADLGAGGPDRGHGPLVAPGGARVLRGRQLFDVETGAEELSLPADAVIPSPDHAVALVVPFQFGSRRPRPAEVWNLATHKRVATLDVLTGDALGRVQVSAAFSPDNSRLVTAVAGAAPPPALVVTGWDVKTGKKLGEFTQQNVQIASSAVAAANNNSGAVLATAEGKLWVADYEKGARAETVDELGWGGVSCPTFSPEGKLFAVGAPTDKPDAFAVRVYGWPSGKLLHTFVGHRGPVTALAFSPDGQSLASGSSDTTVLLWDLTALAKPK
jgi:WD40 repeat protein